MSAQPTTDMRALHAAIEETLRTRFGAGTFYFYQHDPLGPYDETEIQTPALLLELEGFEQDDTEQNNRARERVPVRCTLALHAVLSINTERLQLELRELAADLLITIRAREHALTRSTRGNRWGLGPAADFPERVEAMPAEFTPGLNGRDSWVVRWEQVFYFSNTVSGD